MDTDQDRSALKALIDTHFDELSAYYSRINPSKKDDFKAEIFLPIRRDKSLNFHKYYSDFLVAENQLTVHRANTIIAMACACGVEAIRMYEAESHLAAALFLNDARYWNGVIFSILTFENMINPFIEEEHRKFAKTGGTKRGKISFRRTKTEAQRLARQYRREDASRPSMLIAAKSVLDEVMKFHNELILQEKNLGDKGEKVLPLTSPQRTIKDWLREMEDGKLLFNDWKPPTPRKKKKPKRL